MMCGKIISKQKHLSTQNIYNCDVCGETISTQTDLANHLRTHNQYKCDVWGDN